MVRFTRRPFPTLATDPNAVWAPGTPLIRQVGAALIVRQVNTGWAPTSRIDSWSYTRPPDNRSITDEVALGLMTTTLHPPDRPTRARAGHDWSDQQAGAAFGFGVTAALVVLGAEVALVVGTGVELLLGGGVVVTVTVLPTGGAVDEDNGRDDEGPPSDEAAITEELDVVPTATACPPSWVEQPAGTNPASSNKIADSARRISSPRYSVRSSVGRA